MVDLAQELGCHHFVRAVLDETCDVQETCREAQAEKATVKKKTEKQQHRCLWNRPPCRGATEFVQTTSLLIYCSAHVGKLEWVCFFSTASGLNALNLDGTREPVYEKKHDSLCFHTLLI